MAKKKTTVEETKGYKVLKPFLADKQYHVGDTYKTSKKVEYLQNNKYIK
jgi:hypothetical protein